MKFSIPHALVFCMSYGGLGIVRSLAQAGVPVVAIGSRQHPEMATRWAASRVYIDDLEEETLVRTLLEQAARCDSPPVLFFSYRSIARILSKRRDDLLGSMRFHLPAHDRVIAMEHKEQLAAIAEAAALRRPASLPARSLAEIEPVAEWTPPFIFKPLDNHIEYAQRFRKAYKLESYEALRKVAAEIFDCGYAMIVQQWIPGEDHDIYFCMQYRDEAGRLRASFSGRKLHQWPMGVGAASVVTVDTQYSRQLEALTSAFFERIGLTGYASTEFKRHPETGEFYFVEATCGRLDQNIEVATLNGVNFPLAIYGSLTGLALNGHAASPRPAILQIGDAAKKSIAVKGKALYDTVHRRRVFDSLFRWNDPGPALVEIRGRIENRLRRVAG